MVRVRSIDRQQRCLLRVTFHPRFVSRQGEFRSSVAKETAERSSPRCCAVTDHQ